MNSARDVGTRAETALCDYMEDELGVEVHRRTMQGGGNDRGDLRIPGVQVMIEVKNCKTLRMASWAREVPRQCANAGVPYGVLVWSPPRLGPRSIARWIAMEWEPTALTRFGQGHAMHYGGPINRLAPIVAEYGDQGPIYVEHDGTRIRVRHLHRWVRDLQEHIASLALTR